MEEYTYDLDEQTGKSVSLFLYENVQNVEQVFNKIINKELNCCIVKASLIWDPFQIIIAANKAAINEKYGQMVTRNIYSEIIYCLSMSKNISQSLTTFGISKDTKNILVAIVCKQCERKEQEKLVTDAIQGDKLPILELPKFCNEALIKKTYKIEQDELKVSSLLDSIVSRISDKVIK